MNNFIIKRDEWRDIDTNYFQVSIIKKGSTFYRFIPKSYLSKQNRYFISDILKNSFIRDTNGSLAFLTSKFGNGKRAYFSSSKKNVFNEVYNKSEKGILLECELLTNLHVLEVLEKKEDVFMKLHDRDFVEPNEIENMKEELEYIKKITDYNEGYEPTIFGLKRFHDKIEGVVFKSYKDSCYKTIALFNDKNIKIKNVTLYKNKEEKSNYKDTKLEYLELDVSNFTLTYNYNNILI